MPRTPGAQGSGALAGVPRRRQPVARRARAAIVAAIVAVSVTLSGLPIAATSQTLPETVATGLRNPRGLAFGPDGALYVAVAATAGLRDVRAGQHGVNASVGKTARVVRIEPGERRRAVLENLPSIKTTYDTLGAAAIAVSGDEMYVLTSAGGRPIGDPTYDNAVLRYRTSGPAEVVANISAFKLDRPPPSRIEDLRADVEGGVPFGMTALDGQLYVSDGNHETITEIAPDGSMRRVIEHPTSDRVLVGLTTGPDRALYVAEFGAQPRTDASGSITRVTLAGEQSTVWDGLTAAIGVAFGHDGAMYALEFSSGARTERTGRLLRRSSGDEVSVIAAGLNFPTALTVGPEGDVYVSESGHKAEEWTGKILRFRVAAPVAQEPRLDWQLVAGGAVAALSVAVAALAMAIRARRVGRSHRRLPGTG